MPEKSKGRRRMWRLQQSTGREDTLELYIYGDVEGDYRDWWTGELVESDTSAEYFRRELERWPKVTQINIYINSYGGEVFEGTAIYSQLRRHPAHKTVYVDGFACSIASVIAMAGDEVVMPRNTMMMIHNMWMVASGSAAELRRAADNLDIINAAGRQAYLEKAGDKLSEERLIELMDAESWLTAEQCIALGLADRYADEDADMTAANEMLQKVNGALEARLAVNKSIAAALREMAEGGTAQDEGKRAADGGGKDGNTSSSADAASSPQGDGTGAEAPTLMQFLASCQ